MKKNSIKIIIATLIFTFFLVGCGLSEKAVVGTWKSKNPVYIEMHSSDCNMMMIVYESGQYYEELTNSLGVPVYSAEGRWRIEDGELHTKADGDQFGSSWEYKSGTLVNRNWVLEKK